MNRPPMAAYETRVRAVAEQLLLPFAGAADVRARCALAECCLHLAEASLTRKETATAKERAMDNVVIDGNEIQIEDLNDEGKAFVGRVMELRNELGRLDMQRQELHVLINAYANSIKETVNKEEEEPEIELVN